MSKSRVSAKIESSPILNLRFLDIGALPVKTIGSILSETLESLYLLMILFWIAVMSGCDEGEDISEPNSASNYSVKMGGLFPFTGASSNVGKPLHQGALLAVKHLAEAGFQVGWLVADTQGNPDVSVKAAHELVDKGQAQVLIGSWTSSVTIAVAKEVSIPKQVPHIAYAATSTLITDLPEDEGQDFLFRTISSDALQGAAVAQLAIDTGYQHVSVLYVDNSYGKSLTETFTEAFKALGGTVVAQVPHLEILPPEIKPEESYLAELQQVKVGNTEALVAISYSRHAESYIKQAIAGNFFDKFIFVGGTKSEKITEAVGAENLQGMCGTAHGWEQTDSRQIFDASYEAEYGEIPKSYQPNSYDAVILAGLAAYAAQAIGEQVTPITIRENLRYVAGPEGQEVLAGLEGIKRAMRLLDSGLTINYEGAAGSVDFDENGEVTAPIEIWCYTESGQIETRKLCTVDLKAESQEGKVDCKEVSK